MIDPRFNFSLPEELIAQKPASPRDHARLLVYKRSDRSITDAYFYDLPKFLHPKTTLVLNNTKVDKCRLKFGALEIFMLQTVNNRTTTAMVRPGKKFKLGEQINLGEGVKVKVIDINSKGHRTLEFNLALDSEQIKKHKLTPLPPYIPQDESLSEEYQTVYARDPGSKAAPTAGLHFTDELLDKVNQDHSLVEVTLGVGLGTFAPLSQENIDSKTLHKETYTLSESAAAQLTKAQHITAVGTTSTRLLESAHVDLSSASLDPTDIRSNSLDSTFLEKDRKSSTSSSRYFKAAYSASTDIFLQPDDRLRAVDSMITNFHLPNTSLLMLVAAMIGTSDTVGNQVADNATELMRIYKHAIEASYRFYSFGDAMLVL